MPNTEVGTAREHVNESMPLDEIPCAECLVSNCFVYYSIHSCSHVKVRSNTVQVDKLPLTGESNLFLQFGEGENYHQIMSVCQSG